MLMVRGQMAPTRPWACRTPPVKADHLRHHAPCRRMLTPWAVSSGQVSSWRAGRLRDATAAYPTNPTGLTSHSAMRRAGVWRARRGPNARGLPHAKAPCRLPLALGAGEQVVRRQWGRVACVGGQEHTTVLSAEGLSGRQCGRPRAVALVAPLLGVHAVSRPSACGRAPWRAPCGWRGARGHTRGAHGDGP